MKSKNIALELLVVAIIHSSISPYSSSVIKIHKKEGV